MKLRNINSLILLLSIGSLAFAYYVEYIMNLAACPLCIYQRFPYLILFALAIIALSSEQNYTKYYIITIIGSVLLAGYHTGVERGIFELSTFCKPLVTIGDNLSVMDFKQMLYSEKIAFCNRPALVVFGFSMTEWNLLLNISLLTMLLILNSNKEKSSDA